ncbi:hypothetical protein GOODEAATRI_002179 [Goodea atripinnis]|uniref:Uncharacterized protein n=1 Tax=Goodea atripinnis TaxID=208336 RepID=A0ABV0P0U4_9TELE
MLFMDVVFAPPTTDHSSAFGSRLASSLGDLYAADIEEDEKPSFSSLPPSSSSSVSLSPAPSPLAPPSLSNYGSRTRSMQQEVNNNSTLYSSSVAPPAGKGYIRPQPQDIGAYRGHGPYSAMKGPSGRYLSRSIPRLSVNGSKAGDDGSFRSDQSCWDRIYMEPPWLDVIDHSCGSSLQTSDQSFDCDLKMLD